MINEFRRARRRKVSDTILVTDTMTDFMTVTDFSTIVQPTTIVSVYVSTEIMDEVRRS